ncbi:MAG TPA: class I SAM-dependent methyltransferase [Trebonia sp.]|nr:class I SAM-dependent methyltransferase [Trebonia sp.]
MSPKPRYQEHFDSWYADRAADPGADAVISRHMGLPLEVPPGMIPVEGIPEIIGQLRLKPGDTLLDLGCGRGTYGLEIAGDTGARLIGVDFSEVALDQAREQARRRGQVADFRLAELAATGLPARSVSAVLCADAIGFPEDPVTAFAEMRRVLTPGGRVVVTGWEARDHADERLPSQARRMDVAGSLREAGLADVEVLERDPWHERERAVWEEAAALPPDGPPALSDLRDEGMWALQYFDLRRRLMVTATAP